MEALPGVPAPSGPKRTSEEMANPAEPLASHEVDLGFTLRLGSGIELEPPDVAVLP